MCSSFEYHISPLDQTLVNKLIAVLCSFARLTTASQENPAFFILNRHEVSWYFDVHYVRTIAMRLEVIHEQVVSVVNEEVERVDHFAVVANERHLDCLFNYLYDCLFCLGLLLQ